MGIWVRSVAWYFFQNYRLQPDHIHLVKIASRVEEYKIPICLEAAVPHAFRTQIKISSWVEKCLVAAGPPGDALPGVQPGGGGEAEEDDGGKSPHPQVLFSSNWLLGTKIPPMILCLQEFKEKGHSCHCHPHQSIIRRPGLFDWPSCLPVRRSFAGIKKEKRHQKIKKYQITFW